jgi:hypothetical protein
MPPLTRRELLRRAAISLPALGVGPALWSAAAKASDGKLPPVRQITRGPEFHWFGYYDKLQFCPQNRFVLSNQVDFEGRSPRPDDVIRVGIVDTQNGDEWIELGETRAWGWQQGCMLQWLPGSEHEIIWNDRDDDKFVCHILNVETRERRTLPHAVYNVSPDGKWAVATDFARLNDRRPGYGYAGIPDKHKEVPAPSNSGIWTVDLASGKRELIFSLEQASQIPYDGGPEWQFSDKTRHWFNHLLINTDGSRLWFLHRWTNGRGWATRAFTINRDGSDPYILDPHGRTSHFIWRDPQHVMAWSWHPSHNNAFYLYKDKTDIVEPVGLEVMTENGHNTYVPETNGEWVLNDTYPDKNRLQHPYLYHVPTSRKVPIGHFPSPPAYSGEWRCDTHPRSSRDGKLVCVDSPHNGGRQLYLIDISSII